MKAAFCLLAVVWVCTVAAQEQGKTGAHRTFKTPPHYYKAEEFADLSEVSRVLYISGLMDGFFASAMLGATDKTVDSLSSCTGEMDAKQVTAIITKYVKDHPETWHNPLSIEAYNALIEACPGKLNITN